MGCRCAIFSALQVLRCKGFFGAMAMGRITVRRTEGKPGGGHLWRRLVLGGLALGAIAAATTALVGINARGDESVGVDTRTAGTTRTIAAHKIPLMHHFVNRSGCPDLGLSTEAADPHYVRAYKPREIFSMKVRLQTARKASRAPPCTQALRRLILRASEVCFWRGARLRSKYSAPSPLSRQEFIRSSWYVQELQDTLSHGETENYCVVRTFTQDGLSVAGFKPPFPPTTNLQFPAKFTYSVYEYANVREVNGPPKKRGEGFDPDEPSCLRAMNWQTDTTRKKNVIASCWKPNTFAHPFWVMDVGVRPRKEEPSPTGAATASAGWFNQTRHPGMPIIPRTPEDNTYEWAIVIGGQPDVSHDDGCTVREGHMDQSGLWLMTREPIPSQRVLDEMHASLEAKSIARSRLRPVEHEGCLYDGANLCYDGRCKCTCLEWGPKPFKGVFDKRCIQRECVETDSELAAGSDEPESVGAEPEAESVAAEPEGGEAAPEIR